MILVLSLSQEGERATAIAITTYMESNAIYYSRKKKQKNKSNHYREVLRAIDLWVTILVKNDN